MSLTQQLPRLLQGSAPAVAINQIAQFGVRAGQRSDETAAMFEAAYGRRARPRPQRDRPRRVRRDEAAENDRPAKLLSPPAASNTRHRPFGQALKQIAQLAKANVGLEVAFADVGGWDTHVNQGASQGQLATRLNDFARSIAALATDLGDALDDTVILTMSEFGRAGERERQPRHRSRTRQRDAGDRRRRDAAAASTASGRDSRSSSATSAATSPSPRISATCSARSSVRHLGVADARPIFPGYNVSASRFVGLLG